MNLFSVTIFQPFNEGKKILLRKLSLKNDAVSRSYFQSLTEEWLSLKGNEKQLRQGKEGKTNFKSLIFVVGNIMLLRHQDNDNKLMKCVVQMDKLY